MFSEYKAHKAQTTVKKPTGNPPPPPMKPYMLVMDENGFWMDPRCQGVRDNSADIGLLSF